MVCSIQNVMLLTYNLPHRPVIVSHHMDTFAGGRYAGTREGIVNTVIGFSHRSWTNTSLLVSQRDDFLEHPPILMLAVQPHGLGGDMQRLIGIRFERVTIVTIEGNYNMAINVLQVINQGWRRRAITLSPLRQQVSLLFSGCGEYQCNWKMPDIRLSSTNWEG